MKTIILFNEIIFLVPLNEKLGLGLKTFFVIGHKNFFCDFFKKAEEFNWILLYMVGIMLYVIMVVYMIM